MAIFDRGISVLICASVLSDVVTHWEKFAMEFFFIALVFVLPVTSMMLMIAFRLRMCV